MRFKYVSFLSSNITIGVKEIKTALKVENNNRLIGSHGQLFDSLIVHKGQKWDKIVVIIVKVIILFFFKF